jgi:hypothetical protein
MHLLTYNTGCFSSIRLYNDLQQSSAFPESVFFNGFYAIDKIFYLYFGYTH